MTMMTMRIIQGVGVTVGLSVRWRHQGFGIICPTCFLFTRFSKDLGLLAPPRILDFGLFAQLAFSSESENYFWIWDLGLFAQPRIWDFFQTCLLFTRVTRDTRASKDLGLLVPPRILNYLPNLLSLQHQSQKIIYVFFSSLNQPRLLLEMARITPFDAMNIIAWSSNSQMA